MQMKSMGLAFLFIVGAGGSQVWAQTAAEVAGKAADEAAASASQAAAYAAQGTQEVQALDKAIQDQEALLAELGKGTNSAALIEARQHLDELRKIREVAGALLAELTASATTAQAAADAAREAANRASAKDVSEADARDAAKQALREARKAARAVRDAGASLDILSKGIKDGRFGQPLADMSAVAVPTNAMPRTITTILRTGPTPTDVGRGRRGSL